MSERAFKPKPDWTWDAKGRSNSSPAFKKLCAEVELLIRAEAFTLIAGDAGSTARLIMAQLAHVHKLSPPRKRKP
jgi:transcriptional regulator with GAF, ATPase, and Fis domain